MEINELRTQAKSMGINTRNYSREKLMKLMAESEQASLTPTPKATIQETPKPTEIDRTQEIINILKPHMHEGLLIDFDEVSVTIRNNGKQICTNLSTPNSVILRQVHSFLSPTPPLQRAS